MTHQHYFIHLQTTPYFSSNTQLFEKKYTRCVWCLSFQFLFHHYTTSKQALGPVLFVAAKKLPESNLSSLAPGYSPKSHSSHSPPPQSLETSFNRANPQRIRSAHAHTHRHSGGRCAAGGNKSPPHMPRTTYRAARFCWFWHTEMPVEFLYNINLRAAIKRPKDELFSFVILKRVKDYCWQAI